MRRPIILSALLLTAACGRREEPTTGPAGIEPGGLTPAGTARNEGEPPRAVPVRPAQPESRTSRYSSLGKANCRLVEESEEGPYWRMRCGGVGGYAVDYTESDLRQNIAVVAPGGTKTSLDLPSRVANGAFDRLGAKIEWRGPAGGRPDALIVRVHVANDQGEDDGGRLAVARLAPRPCLIGIVPPGPSQNEKAQALADKGGACL